MANPLSRAALRRWLGGHLAAALLSFALGVVAGVAVAATVDFGAVRGILGQSPFSDELTFRAILVDDLIA